MILFCVIPWCFWFFRLGVFVLLQYLILYIQFIYCKIILEYYFLLSVGFAHLLKLIHILLY